MPYEAPIAGQKRRQQQRGNSSQRGYNHQWKKARLAFLKENPLCVECQADGKTTAATVVDHIIPHRGDQELFWDANNWQPMCQHHQNAKTRRGE